MKRWLKTAIAQVVNLVIPDDHRLTVEKPPTPTSNPCAAVLRDERRVGGHCPPGVDPHQWQMNVEAVIEEAEHITERS